MKGRNVKTINGNMAVDELLELCATLALEYGLKNGLITLQAKRANDEQTLFVTFPRGYK